MDTSKIQKGIIGQFYDGSLRTCISLLASENIPIGVPLMRGTDPVNQVQRFNGSVTTEMVGVSGFSALQSNGHFSTTETQGYYLAKTPVTVVKEGKIWIPLTGTQTITVGDTAYIDSLFDRITNVYTEFQTAPIGRFLTGGVTTTNAPVLFVIELIEGYTEPTPVSANLKGSESETVFLKTDLKEVNFKKSKEKK